MPAYGPMLAATGKETQLDSLVNHVFEPKLDGIRCLVYMGEGKIILYSRTLKDMTYQFPDVMRQLSSLVLPPGLTIIDGEIVAVTFQELQSRLQRVSSVADYARTTPAKFVAFDLLMLNNESLVNHKFHERRTNLLLTGVETTEQSSNGRDLFHKVIAIGGEGVMAKDRYAKYYPDQRNKAWIKIKPTNVITAYVGGATFGIGKRKDTIGAILIGDLRDNGALRYLGAVGTGFSDKALEEMAVIIKQTQEEESHFVDFPITMPQANSVKWYCRPTLKVRVAFQEKTRAGILKFPAFRNVVW